MAWTIKFDKKAKKELSLLDKTIEKRIISYLRDRIAHLANPRQLGEGLKGNMSNLWRYRVGDYRIICNIEDNIVTVIVVSVKHRKEVYKRQ